MALIVQKFGGSSVADVAGLKRVAKRIVDTVQAGNQVVAVVSAMGDTTDELIDLAEKVTEVKPSREMDMLLTTGETISTALLTMAIKNYGVDARPFNGSQAGLMTDTAHGSARIIEMGPERVQEVLAEGAVPVVAGFQGFSPETNDITTLGRGGSDTTAVALAASISADECQIFTDVDGVFTADPRMVPLARKINAISSTAMIEFAAAGAKVLHLRSVEFAHRHHVNLRVRSSFASDPGTIIYDADKKAQEGAEMEEPLIAGIACDMNDAKITIVGVPDALGRAARVFDIVGNTGTQVDMIVQNVSVRGAKHTDISFTVPTADLNKVLVALTGAKDEIGFEGLQHDDKIAKISVVGSGIRSNVWVCAKIFQTLSDAGINIEMISTSEIRITVATNADSAIKAQTALHTAFGLDSDTEAIVYAGTGR